MILHTARGQILAVITHLDAHPLLSEETPCFTATLTVGGQTYQVSNRGQGGCNQYHPRLPRNVQQQLDTAAARDHLPFTLDEVTSAEHVNLPMDFETWTFMLAFAQVETKQNRQHTSLNPNRKPKP